MDPELAKWIIGGLVAAIVGLAGYVKYLVGKVSAGQARIDALLSDPR